MPNTPELSETKRALLEKYLRGEIPQAATTASTIPQRSQESPAPASHTDSRAPVVAVQTGGSKRPFFYLHVHWQGGAFYCFPLSHDLGSDQPFYVLEPYKFDGLRVLPTLEAIATAYIESICAIQPEGPYLLGSFCGGGPIAFEMAQQLRAKGQAVDLLVLIEPGVTGRMRPVLERHGPTFLRLAGSFTRRIGNLIRLGPDKQLDWFLWLRHVYRLLKHSKHRNSQGLSLVPTAEALRQDWMGIFVWLVSDYVPRQYPGKVTYFWASEEPSSRREAWSKMAKAEEVEIHFIPGTHNTCRTEHIRDLADQLRTCLNKAQAAEVSERA